MQWEPKHTIAAQIQAAKADYILSLKANHPTLLAQVQGWFETTQTENQLPQSSEYKLESAHHRIEIRQVWMLPIECFPQLHEAHEWIGLRTIVLVKRRRHLWHKTTHDEVQFSLSSLPADRSRIGAAIRQHWGIENAQHWVLDVTFGKMPVAFFLCMHPRFWRFSVASPFMSGTKQQLANAVSNRKANRPQ
jgi:predicted transposase YbfD/YdcC